MSGRYMTRSNTLAKSAVKQPSQIDDKANMGYQNVPSSLSKKASSSPHTSLKRKRDLQIPTEDLPSVRESCHTSSKLKTNSTKTSKSKKAVDNDNGYATFPTEDASSPFQEKEKKSQPPTKDKNEEKRLRVFRKRAPLSYLEKLERATSQRCVGMAFQYTG